MKLYNFITAAAVLFIAPALSQDLASLPECAQSPILEAAAETGCSLSDLVCICSDSGLVEHLLELIPTVCTPEEVLEVSEFGDAFCLLYASLTLSLSDIVTIPSATATGAATTSNGSPATASAETTETSASASATAAATSASETESATESAAESDAAATSNAAVPTNIVGLPAFLGAAALGLAAVL
ncbi:hypothetical protein B0A52_07251 [Exophiala mesophila]|uniref:CFEM domain-containing protein n=1 Tax=Exophiala mesophila TaxID=212818 RepID=A0A438MWV6_EXOME|nr:hypothetical protein B0A52_07251 [Exophiala mesophila]